MVTVRITVWKIATYIKPITLMEWGFRARTRLRDECDPQTKPTQSIH